MTIVHLFFEVSSCMVIYSLVSSVDGLFSCSSFNDYSVSVLYFA